MGAEFICRVQWASGVLCVSRTFFDSCPYGTSQIPSGRGVETVFPWWKLELCVPWIGAETLETGCNYESIWKGGMRKEWQSL